jgi:AhpD family alkylhydroperoxidase
MQSRVNVAASSPQGYAAVLGVHKYLQANVEGRVYELIKLRASMQNGCAFCVDMHGTDMIGTGEDVRRVLALSAWRESSFFGDDERAVLALTDELTTLDDHGVRDETWAAAHAVLGDGGIADVVMAIGLINLFNRIAISTHQPTPPLASA